MTEKCGHRGAHALIHLEALPPRPVTFILYFQFTTVKLTGESEKTLSRIIEYIHLNL